MTGHLINSGDLGAPHGFLSREDGVSSGLYQGLNCGPGSNDDPDLVRENRRIAASLISGRRDTPLLSCYQVHGAHVVEVHADWDEERPKADAMVTHVHGVLLGILTADCVPVLFAEADAGVIGAAHAGWKGALKGVLENTLDAMERLGAVRSNIRAAVGPCIQQPSYEVGAEMRAEFLASRKDAERFFEPGQDESHFQFDLSGFVTERLDASGIANVWRSDIDTYSSDSHFSFRRTTHRGEADYGRQISAIMLAGP